MFKVIDFFCKKTSNGIQFFSRVVNKLKNTVVKRTLNDNLVVTPDIVFSLIQQYLQISMGVPQVSYQTHFVADLNIPQKKMVDLAYEIQNNLVPDGFLDFLAKNKLVISAVSDMVSMTMAFYTLKRFEQIKHNTNSQKVH